VAIHAEAEAKATALELVQNEEHDSNGWLLQLEFLESICMTPLQWHWQNALQFYDKCLEWDYWGCEWQLKLTPAVAIELSEPHVHAHVERNQKFNSWTTAKIIGKLKLTML
jgi:hypothetical protein